MCDERFSVNEEEPLFHKEWNICLEVIVRPCLDWSFSHEHWRFFPSVSNRLTPSSVLPPRMCSRVGAGYGVGHSTGNACFRSLCHRHGIDWTQLSTTVFLLVHSVSVINGTNPEWITSLVQRPLLNMKCYWCVFAAYLFLKSIQICDGCWEGINRTLQFATSSSATVCSLTHQLSVYCA